MSRKTYFVLMFLGFLWGVFGGHIIGEHPPLIFGWLPLSVLSICLTGFYAAVINYIYFKNFG
ncbi:MAG: hypothetical protein Q3993_07045 [Filifactor alocis]|nr:hypothetical protein [Filifactor alocis]